MRTRTLLLALPAALGLAGVAAPRTRAASPPPPYLSIPGDRGPGKGKTVVLIAADEEYRSEDVIPELARILAHRHGFNCTVLFGMDPNDGTINPHVITNIPGLDQLRKADLLVIFARWRNLPDDQMKELVDYIESGRPIVGIRTATHAFKLASKTYAKYTWDSTEPGWEGGFGRKVLGETWIRHHGAHGKEGTRGIAAPGQEGHPILRGIQPGSIFGWTDVYGVRLPLPGDSTPIVMGQVTESFDPASKPVEAKNHPMMPIAWTKTYHSASGNDARVFTSTIGAATDFQYEGTRRLLVNGVYWAAGLEKKTPKVPNVDLVGPFKPTMYGDKKPDEYRSPSIRPADLPK